MKKNVHGITLIALVITIIVLLILAGVSISMLTGKNGILNKVIEAKEKTNLGQQQEKNDIANIEEIINENINESTVEKVTDSDPGVLEKESDTIYTISSIEDLVFFAYDVRVGNTYDGKTVKLKQNLDFNSIKSYVDAFRTDYGKYGYTGELKTLLTSKEGFIPIGLTEKNDATIKEGSFAGTFDGNGYYISNCYINIDATQDTTKTRIAFFGRHLYGEVKNFGLININYTLVNSKDEGSVSGFSTTSIDGSKISNCYVSGNIKQISKGDGNVNCSGISTYNKGIIENTYNLATIQGEIDNENAGCYLGGITVNHEDNYIDKCYNSGKIIGKGGKGTFQIGGITRITGVKTNEITQVYNKGEICLELLDNCSFISLGGIAGSLSNRGDSTLENVYNSGKITIKGTHNYTIDQIEIGGIAGGKSKSNNNMKISNSYNIGELNLNNINNISNIGKILGVIRNNTKIDNCFYLENSIYNGIGTDNLDLNQINISTISSKQNLLTNLNKNQDNIWKNDEKNINYGYPILYWQ